MASEVFWPASAAIVDGKNAQNAFAGFDFIRDDEGRAGHGEFACSSDSADVAHMGMGSKHCNRFRYAASYTGSGRRVLAFKIFE